MTITRRGISAGEMPEIACRVAVQRCYDSLCQKGQPERYALEAAVVVYRYHRPEAPPKEAESVVGYWVTNTVRH